MPIGSIRFPVVAAAMTLIGGSMPAAAELPATFGAEADAYIDAAWPADGPGAVVVIMENGKIVYERGRGLSDLENGQPITPSTVFRLGSITKQFAAAVVMQLVDEGQLSLDDPLSKFLPGYPEPAATATVRQLLNHTSGIQSYTSLPGWMTEANLSRPHTTEQMVAVFKDLPPVTSPGETWAYNNSGYILVGAIIEKITGKPWYKAVQERLTAPLKLTTIRYGVEEATTGNMAKGYTAGDKGPVAAQTIHLSVPHAAGGLIGSAPDLAKWSQALHGGKVLSSASYAQMIAPTKMPKGADADYGFGLAPGQLRGQRAIGHGGGIPGFATDSVYLPDRKLFVAVFTNVMPGSREPNVVMRRLAALALGAPYPSFEEVAVEEAALMPFTGIYRQEGEPADETGKLAVRDGKLYLQLHDQPQARLLAASDNRFFFGPNSLTWLQFRRDPTGSHQLTIYEADEKPKHFVWAAKAPVEAAPFSVSREVLESYVGQYKSDHFVIAVYLDEAGRPHARMEGKGVAAMRATSSTEFDLEGTPLRLVFEPVRGTTSRLTVHSGNETVIAERVPAS